jgi:flagellar hook assembly protein FlgD
MAYYESLNIGVIILSNGEINSLTDLLAGMVPALVQWAMQHGIAENTTTTPTVVNLNVSPNPFTHITDIRYTIPELRNSNFEMRKPTLKIYDATGRLVRDFFLPTTYYLLPTTVTWDGTDQSNRTLGSGVYFIKLTSGNFEETKKVLLIR